MLNLVTVESNLDRLGKSHAIVDIQPDWRWIFNMNDFGKLGATS